MTKQARAYEPGRVLAMGALALAALSLGCRDLSRFSTKGDRFEGAIVAGSFVRSGLGQDVRMCLTLDTDRLQDAPGAVTTSDGRFRETPLRPIPQIWHDPLSTLSFGDGRVQNLVYAASPLPGDPADAGDAEDALVVVSLMQHGGVEVRMLRGAPRAEPDARARALFGVFALHREPGPCAF